MTCGEVRELLFAFLDNELDAALSIELQRHLEHCPECAREAETERTIQKRLAATMELEAVSLPPADDLLHSIVATPATERGRRRMRRSMLIPLGVGIAAILVLGVIVRNQLSPPRGSPPHDGLVNLLVADFDHFLSEGRTVHIASNDRDEVSQWLHGKTGLTVSLPATTGGHCKLIGGRKCKLSGQPAAFASYEMDRNPACLVVLAGGSDSLAKLERVSRDGRTYWVDRRKDRSVVACLRDDLIYAAVSRTDKDDLIHFMSELE